MENSNNQLEPAVKALAATAISQSLSFCMERKYLQGIENGDLFLIVTGLHLITVDDDRPLQDRRIVLDELHKIRRAHVLDVDAAFFDDPRSGRDQILRTVFGPLQQISDFLFVEAAFVYVFLNEFQVVVPHILLRLAAG